MFPYETEQRPAGGLNEQGVALLLSIVAMSVLALVVTGGFYMVRQEFRASLAGERAAHTLGVSESGVAEVLADWQGEPYAQLPIGGGTQVTSLGSEGSALVDIRRVSERLYFLDSRASLYSGPSAGRRVGVLTRLVSPNLVTGAAALTLNSATLDGSVTLTGIEFNPLSWGGLCAGFGGSGPGLTIPDDSLTTVVAPAALAGSPPVIEVPSLGAGALHDFGGITRSTLASLADIVLAGGPVGPTSPQTDVNGNCLAAPTNWGDPNDPTGSCGRHFPIVHVTGDAELLPGTVGQGMLLVDGDLRVNGNVRFYGMVSVLGHLEIEGSGTLFAGHVRASDLTMRNLNPATELWVTASKCSVTRAVLNNPNLTRPEILPQRSWVDLTALGG